MLVGPRSALASTSLAEEAAAHVTVMQPEDGAVRVPLDSPLTVVFSSPIVALGPEADKAALPAPIVLDPPARGWANG